MKSKLPLLSRLYALFALATAVAVAEVRGQDSIRVWTDSSGRQVSAILSGFEDASTLILKLEDGRTLPFPIEKLSAPDREFALAEFERRASSQEIDWENPASSEDYVIRGVTRENSPGYVSTKGGWVYQAECIEVRVQYRGDKDFGPGNVSAYFYNRDGALIEKFDKPTRQQDENRQYVNPPTEFEEGETIETYFPITEFLEESDWATVLVVFGSGSSISVDTFPKTSYENLDFAGKRIVFPGWEPSSSPEMGSESSASDVELEVRRIREQTFSESIIFNGDYQSGKECVSAEVRATGSIQPGEGEVTLHCFDESGRLAASRTRPSSAELDDSKYVREPRIADESWHPVFFALDRELEDKSFPTYVVVFEFGGRTAALVQSSVGATLDSLSFPEKSRL